jgi:hypothetical protein
MRKLSVLYSLIEPQELANDRGKVTVLAYQDSNVVLIIESERKHMTCYLDIDSLLLLVLDSVLR